MINWYIPLYLGVIFILYIFPNIGSHNTIKEYLVGKKGLMGLGIGTNVLLSRLVTGDIIILAVISIIKFGFWGGLGITLIEMTSFGMFILVISYVKRNFPNKQNVFSVFQEKLSELNFKLFLLTLFFCNLGNMLCGLIVIKYLLGDYFVNNSLLIILLINIFSCIYAGLGGFDILRKGAKIQVILVFFTTAILTIFIFLEKGLVNTYKDYSINFLQSSLDFFWVIQIFVVGVLIRFSQYFFDNSLWNIVFCIKKQRLNTILGLTIFCLVAIPLSYSAISIFCISANISSAFPDIVIKALESLDFSFLLNLYVMTIFITVISNYSINLYSLVGIYLTYYEKNNPNEIGEKSIIKRGYRFALLITILCMIIYFLFDFELINYIVFLGIFFTSFLIPGLKIIVRPSSIDKYFVFISIVSMLFGGFFFLNYKIYFSPLISLSSSMVLVLIFNISKKMQKIL